MSETVRNEQLAESRAILRETWPSLTDLDLDGVTSRSRAEAADVIQQRTGEPMEKITTALSELFGLIPERHETSD